MVFLTFMLIILTLDIYVASLVFSTIVKRCKCTLPLTVTISLNGGGGGFQIDVIWKTVGVLPCMFA